MSRSHAGSFATPRRPPITSPSGDSPFFTPVAAPGTPPDSRRLLEPEAPKDKWNLTYLIFVIQGVGMLMPGNTFNNAERYFHYRVCGTSHADSLENWFTAVYSATSGVGLAMSVTLQHRFKPRTRVIIPLVLSLLLFILTTALVLVSPASLPADSLFGVTMATLAVIGFCNAIQQGGFFGIAGQLPPAYIGAIMTGFGLAGAVVSSANAVTTAASAQSSADICESDYDSLKWTSFAYFCITDVFLLVCIILYGVMERMEFVRFHAKLDATEGAEDGREKLLPVSSDVEAHLNRSATSAKSGNPKSTILLTARRLSVLIYAVVLNFATTFLMFPAVTVKIKSVFQDTQSARFFHDLFTPCGFVTYSVADFFGRVCAGKKQLIPNTKGGHAVLAAVVTLRLVFVPLFLLCNVVPDKGYDSGLTVVFNNDAWFFVFMFIFSASGGYLGSLTMMYGPSQVPAEDQENAGTMMVFFLTFGLILGSASSFAWLPLINKTASSS